MNRSAWVCSGVVSWALNPFVSQDCFLKILFRFDQEESLFAGIEKRREISFFLLWRILDSHRNHLLRNNYSESIVIRAFSYSKECWVCCSSQDKRGETLPMSLLEEISFLFSAGSLALQVGSALSALYRHLNKRRKDEDKNPPPLLLLSSSQTL